MIRFLFVKFIDAEIAKKLQSHQHAQQIDIENLKFKINNLSGRASSIYLKEYEHLPNFWISLNESYRSAMWLAGGVRSYPDLNSASPHDLSTFLGASDLADWQKDRLLKAADRNRVYIDIVSRREYRQAIKDHNELMQNVDKYAIFFSVEIKREMLIFAEVLKDAIIEYDIFVLEKADGMKIERAAREELRKNGSARLENLEQKIRDRLWDADNAAVAVSPAA